MIKHNLRELKLRLSDLITQRDFLQSKIKENDNRAVTKASWERELKPILRAIVVQGQRLRDYGGGTVVKVTGILWEGKEVKKREPFEYYIYCENISEAKEIFESQVSENLTEIDPQTISYQTFSLKQFIINN